MANALRSLLQYVATVFGTRYNRKKVRNYFPSLSSSHMRSGIRNKQTPCFIIDRSIVVRRYKDLRDALDTHWGSNAAIAYSFKTNYAVAKSKILKQPGAFAEVVSRKEYDFARNLGYKGPAIVFNGPVKRDDDLRMAIQQGSIIHVDNKEELFRLAHIASAYRGSLSIGLRIRGSISGLSESRFGFSIERGDAQTALNVIKKHSTVSLHSIHLHAGSDLDRIDIYENAATLLAKFCLEAERILSHPVSILDVGGGFPSHAYIPFGRDGWSPKDIHVYIRTISDRLKLILGNNGKKKLIVEPGRYLVDDAVVFISSVVDIRNEDGTQRLVTDGSVTMLPLRYYRPQIVKVFSRNLAERDSQMMRSIVYGGSCREDDILFEGMLPTTQVGDFVVYYCVGAYNQSMGSDFIFGKPSVYFVG